MRSKECREVEIEGEQRSERGREDLPAALQLKKEYDNKTTTARGYRSDHWLMTIGPQRDSSLERRKRTEKRR